jgi:hypothetical protein
MKPETTESSLNTNNTQAPSLEPTAPPEPSTPTTTQAPSLQPTAPPVPTRARRRGHRGNAAKYGTLDRAAESWTDRELTECLRRNLD